MAKLVLGMMMLYYALTLLGAEAQKRGLRQKICKDRVSLVFLALRALLMPWLLTHERQVQALFHSHWSLGYESGQESGQWGLDSRLENAYYAGDEIVYGQQCRLAYSLLE